MSESLSSRRSTLVLSLSTQALITLGWVVGDWRPGPDSVSSRGPADVLLLLLKFNPDSDHSGLGSGAGARGGCLSRSSTSVINFNPGSHHSGLGSGAGAPGGVSE